MNDSQEQPEADKHQAVYVGPRPYLLGQELYGRDREAVEVVRLLISQRLVLLHSPSGAGKSSLIHAKIVPALQKRRFEIPFHEDVESGVPQPIAIRLNREPVSTDPPGSNRYKLSALLSLELQRPKTERRSVDELAGMRIDDYLEEAFPAASREAGDSESEAGAFRPLLLLFDQFEEVLTMDPTDEPVKQEFIRELGDALKNKGRWAMFAVREDYLGALEPYLPALPTGLSATYRLDLLRAEKATAAIEEPARGAGVSFEEGVIEDVVEDLRRIRVQAVDGSFREIAGIYIEPVQLQVVCQSLWRIRGNSPVITHEHLEKLGQGRGTGVDAVLAGYYADRVAEAASEQKVSERLVRNWFNKSLIGSQQIRRPVLVDEALSFGLSVHCLEVLDKAFLIRRENRSGATWYELAHDRLMRPVLEDNELWRNKHLTTFQSQAEHWEDRNRPESLLFSGETLEEAEREAEELQVELTSYEKDFLEASQKARARQRVEQAQKQQLERVKVLRKAVAGGAFLLVLMIALASVAFWQWMNAAKQKEFAQRLVYAGDIRLSQRHLTEGASQLARALLDQTMTDYRGWEYEYLDAKINSNQNTLVGHLASVRSASFFKAGTQVVTASVDSDLMIWDATTHKRITTLEGDKISWINAVAVSPDEKWIVSGTGDYGINVWDAGKREIVRVLNGHHTDTVTSLAIDSQGKWLISGSQDRTLGRWNYLDGTFSNPMKGHEDAVLCVVISPDGKSIYSGSSDKTIKRWTPEGEPIATIRGHEGPVTCLAISLDGNWLASGSDDHRVILWDLRKGSVQKHWASEKQKQAVSSVALKVDDRGTLLAIGSRKGLLTEWDVSEILSDSNVRDHQDAADAPEDADRSTPHRLRQTMQIQAHSGIITSLHYSPVSRVILSSSTDNTAKIWDGPPARNNLEFAGGHSSPVWAVVFDPQGEWLASGGEDSTLQMRPSRDPEAAPVIIGKHKKAIWCLAVSPDGKRLATGSEDNTIKEWDTATRREIRTLSGHSSAVTDLVYGPDPNDRWLISSSDDDTLKMWDESSNKPIRTFTGHTNDVTGVDISPDGKHALSASKDQTIRVWNVKTGQLVQTFRDLSVPVWRVAFSPDGQTFASGSTDGTLQIREFPSGKKGLKLRGHTAWVTTVNFSPDGKRLVSGSEDNTVKLWELETGHATLTLTDHHDTVWSVRFSTDGKRLVSSSEDWTIIVWDATPVSPP